MKTILILLAFSILPLFFPTPSFAQITLDPHNPGARPNPSSLISQNIREVRLVLKDDTVTINYVKSLKQAGINVIGIMNWEYNHAAWTTGNIDGNYVQNFNNLLQDAYNKFGPLKAYQIWNEPDGVAGTIPLTPQAYASLLASSNNLLHSLNQPLISAGFVSGNIQYVKDMLESLGGTFPADGIAYHPYVNPSIPNAIQNVINGIIALNSLTNRPVWITEFGWETPNQNAQAAWLGTMFSLLNNPTTRPILQTVMWYAYSDAQKAGFGLLNADGSPKISFTLFLQILAGGPIPPDLLQQLLDLLVPVPTITPGLPVDLDINCSDSEYQGVLRPRAYSAACKIPKNVPNQTSSNATTFTVITQKDFDVEDVNANKIECNDEIYAKFSWGALITENYTKTETPWVSFGKNTEDNKTLLPEAKYLADYIEGTALYDGKNYLLSNDSQQSGTWQNTGVLRKLAPDWYQDELKCAMIEKAKNDNKYNYTVKLAWSNEDITVFTNLYKALNTLITPEHPIKAFYNLILLAFDQLKVNINASLDFLCLNPLFNPCEKQLKDFTCPPTNANERLRFNFFNPVEAHLWPAVPMFSREDTPGTVTFTAQHPPGNLSGITQGYVDNPPNKVTHSLSIPHVQRANDLSKTLMFMILPTNLQKSIALSEAKSTLTIIASANNSKTENTPVLPPKSLLAEAPTSTTPFIISVFPRLISHSGNNYSIGWQVSYSQNTSYPNYSGYDFYDVGFQVSINGQPAGGPAVQRASNASFNPTYINDDFGVPALNLTLQPGEKVTVSITFTSAGAMCGGNPSNTCSPQGQTFTNTCDVMPDGSLGNCTVISAVIPPPACGLAGRKVGDKNISGRLDPKDPDKLDNVRNEPLQQNLENIDAVPTNPMRAARFSDKLRECRECRDRPGYHDCSRQCRVTFNYETEISSTLLLPYLEKIQKYTAKSDQSGFLNIIRSASLSGFKTTHSKTNVEYYAENGRDLINGGSLNVQVNPSSGYVEFPFLQGVYDAQACVSQRLLLPANFAANVPCPISTGN